MSEPTPVSEAEVIQWFRENTPRHVNGTPVTSLGLCVMVGDGMVPRFEIHVDGKCAFGNTVSAATEELARKILSPADRAKHMLEEAYRLTADASRILSTLK